MILIPCKRCGSTCIHLRQLTYKSWNPLEQLRIEYFMQCVECDKAGAVADTVEKAKQFWNKAKK